MATAEHSSIAKASAQLNVSQPSVSKAITNLEEQLAAQLFIRHHARGVTLTPTGERMLVDARRLLRHGEELQENVQASSNTTYGQLELACFLTVGPVFMPSLLADFSERFPGVEISLHEGDQDELVDGLTSGRFELAIMYNLLTPDEIQIDDLASFDPYVLLPEGHPLAEKKKIFLADLEDEPMILLDVPPSRDYFTGIFRKVGIQPRIAFSSPSMEMVRGLVGRHRGFSLLVTHPYFDQTYDGHTIVTRPLTDDTESGRLGIARLHQLRPSRVMNEFSEFCKAWFALRYPGRGPCQAAPVDTVAYDGPPAQAPAALNIAKGYVQER